MFALLKRRDFALVWTASLISATGDWILFIGLPIYVYQLTGSTLATSAMFVAALVPQIALGSVAGVFAGVLGGFVSPIPLLIAMQGGSYVLLGLAALALLPHEPVDSVRSSCANPRLRYAKTPGETRRASR